MKKIAIAIYKPLKGMEDERFTIGKQYEAYSSGKLCFITDDTNKSHPMSFGFFEAHFMRLG